jgi:hypothetical protein
MDLSVSLLMAKKLDVGRLSSAEQHRLMNLAEHLYSLLQEKEGRISDLEDLVNELKGEQGKPKIAGKNRKEDKEVPKSSEEKNHSSEKERKSSKKKKPKSNKFSNRPDLELRIEVLDIAEHKKLPADAVFQSYRTSHYYDFCIEADLIEYRRKVYYSASTGKYYVSDLPTNCPVKGDYTYSLQEQVYRLKYKYGMPIGSILQLLEDGGVEITKGTLSNLLLSVGEVLSSERDAIHQAGISVGLYTSSDTTLDRFNGENHHAHIFCNQWFTTYYTRSKKDRQTVIDLLRCNKERLYLLNEQGIELCKILKSNKAAIKLLESHLFTTPKTAIEFKAYLEEHLFTLSDKAFQSCQKRIYEAAYLAAYYEEKQLGIFLSDNAPQYNLISLFTALCWIHVGRHFKKMNPTNAIYQKQLKDFLLQFWMYYDWLLNYKKSPTPELKQQLQDDFDVLFSIETDYDQLNDRIDKTKALKDKLLVVLDNPDLPLHNNGAELAARRQVRYRDISFQTRSEKGRNAKNIALSIYQTCKKLGVDATQYILDKLTQKNQMIPLADLIFQKTNYAV